MIPTNPGNLLPFHLKRRYQRHRQAGQNRVPFGLTAPRTRLMPFQIWVEGWDSSDNITWQLVNPLSDAGVLTLDDTILSKDQKGDNSGFWLTWYADQTLVDSPDCGFYYIRVIVETSVYDSEVLYLTDVCGEDDALLTLVEDSCSVDGSTMTFSLASEILATPGYTYSLQRLLGTWTEVSTDPDTPYEAQVGIESITNVYFRIQITTVCGAVLTRQYLVDWDRESETPCDTLTVTFSLENNNTDNVDGEGWRLVCANLMDKANVLYQGRYLQYLYCTPVWDTPEIERDVQQEVDGNGDPTRSFTRTVERKKFEIADLPDYVIGFLVKCGDLDEVYLQDAVTGDEIRMLNTRFESRRQGSSLNIGVFTFDSEVEAFADCQEDFTLL